MWGSFAGPVLAGALYDRTQDYTPALWILLGLLVLATVLVVLLIRPWAKHMTPVNIPPAQE
jgi:nitrate/nitrite transporter NarK